MRKIKTDYSLSGWVRYNTTKHWINMTAENFLTHGGSEPAIFSVNQGELNLYVTGADVMLL